MCFYFVKERKKKKQKKGKKNSKKQFRCKYVEKKLPPKKL